MHSQILNDREQRYNKLLGYTKAYKAPVLCGKLNYPGTSKNNGLTDYAFLELRSAILQKFSHGIIHEESLSGDDGKSFVVVLEMDVKMAKELAVEIEENHDLGRIMDIDIYNKQGQPISRGDIGQSMRRCLVCNRFGKACMIDRRHSIDELLTIINERIVTYHKDQFCKEVGRNAFKALMYEVSAAPKPGLVDRYNSGAHTDMDYFTFLDSGMALENTFYQCAKTGYHFGGEDLKELLRRLRALGRHGEEHMNIATNNVNTHKGLIFSLGIIAAVSGHLFKKYKKEEITSQLICKTVSQMTKGISKAELSSKGIAKTYGEKLYQLYGIKGIRGEVESGFKTIRDKSLPLMIKLFEENTLSLNDMLVQVVLKLYTCTEDTNVLGRHGKETLRFMQNESQKILNMGGVYTQDGYKSIYLLDEIFIKERISPGGAADLLAITIMLFLMEGYNF